MWTSQMFWVFQATPLQPTLDLHFCCKKLWHKYGLIPMFSIWKVVVSPTLDTYSLSGHSFFLYTTLTLYGHFWGNWLDNHSRQKYSITPSLKSCKEVNFIPNVHLEALDIDYFQNIGNFFSGVVVSSLLTHWQVHQIFLSNKVKWKSECRVHKDFVCT